MKRASAIAAVLVQPHAHRMRGGVPVVDPLDVAVVALLRAWLKSHACPDCKRDEADVDPDLCCPKYRAAKLFLAWIETSEHENESVCEVCEPTMGDLESRITP